MTTVARASGPVPFPEAGPLARLRTWLRRDREDRLDAVLVDEIADTWRDACTRIGPPLAHAVQTVTGPTISTPRITDLVLGPPLEMVIKMLPGQVPADYRATMLRWVRHVAAGYGHALVEPIGRQHVRLRFVAGDPLAELLELVPAQLGPVLLGRLETGDEIREDWCEAGHMIVQGQTRSGKSVFTYSLLAQLAGRPDVLIAGIDPTGLLFRPFAGTRHAEWQTSGLVDLATTGRLLDRLVREMDARIAALPAAVDQLEVTSAVPMLVVVLEEYPGLLRAADMLDKKIGIKIRTGVSRLLAEGAKVGLRVVMIAQRAEAATVGAFERAQCASRLSFRVDNRSAIELLHPGTDPLIADAHTTAPPGIALLSAPCRDLERLRAPLLVGEGPPYSRYVTAVRSACRPSTGGSTAA